MTVAIMTVTACPVSAMTVTAMTVTAMTVAARRLAPMTTPGGVTSNFVIGRVSRARLSGRGVAGCPAPMRVR